MKVGIISPKGGQGVTTVASALAAWHSGFAPTTLYANRDTAACLGIPAGHGDPWRNERLTVLFDNESDVTDNDFVVYDGQTGDINLMVVRPCYLTLHRAVREDTVGFYKVDGLIVIEEPGRALTATDVERALGRSACCVIPFAPEVSRCIDAGLMLQRMPKTLTTAMGRVYKWLTRADLPAGV